MPGPSADTALHTPGTHAGQGPLLVLVAVEFEARGLTRRLGVPREGAGYLLRTVGLGATALARLEGTLDGVEPRAILVTGLAGGCAPDVAPGDLVLGDPVGPTPGGAWLRADAGLADRALATLRTTGLPHRVGPLLTVGDLLATPAQKAAAWRVHRAAAADMESAHVLEWAARAGLPALAVRAVADGPADLLPAAVTRAVGPAGQVRLATVGAWLARPTLLRAAWRIWRRSELALDCLARFLAALAPPTSVRS